MDFDDIFNGNWPRMIASEPGNIGNLPGMIVSFPGNILWTVRSIFEMHYSSNMGRKVHIGAVIQLKYGSYAYRSFKLIQLKYGSYGP